MINTRSYITEIQDINHVAYLTAVKGYEINEIRRVADNKTGKEIMTFVFYDNHNLINFDLAEYLSSECAKFIQSRNSLLSLIRQSKSITREEFLDKANGNG
jgi:hypothetical protein